MRRLVLCQNVSFVSENVALPAPPPLSLLTSVNSKEGTQDAVPIREATQMKILIAYDGSITADTACLAQREGK